MPWRSLRRWLNTAVRDHVARVLDGRSVDGLTDRCDEFDA